MPPLLWPGNAGRDATYHRMRLPFDKSGRRGGSGAARGLSRARSGAILLFQGWHANPDEINEEGSTGQGSEAAPATGRARRKANVDGGTDQIVPGDEGGQGA